ncbi:ATP-binding protein [Streptomyces sp. NPDC093085]|uniref:ATP-binding protein n=1 Tax=Streptomyces sp. NPDC093085 TaxID=3155068 RepID=UPI003434EF07
MAAAQEVPGPDPESAPEPESDPEPEPESDPGAGAEWEALAGFGPVVRTDSLMYTAVLGSVTLARRRAGRLVTEWGRPEWSWSAALLVGELGSNALLHGCLRDRLFRVRLLLGRSVLRIEVSDPRGERLPILRRATDEECFGRGLLIVEQVADRWGVVRRAVGKTVWCELGSL